MVPNRLNDTPLSMEEMQDNLHLCYRIWPIGLDDRCNGSAEGFSVDHALKCTKGGLVYIRHNGV